MQNKVLAWRKRWPELDDVYSEYIQIAVRYSTTGYRCHSQFSPILQTTCVITTDNPLASVFENLHHVPGQKESRRSERI
jgi:hypothetical protein